MHKLRHRRGATLIELLVALLLFDMALLTVAAMSALAARQLGIAGRRNRAAVAASSRIEQLTSGACGASASGSRALERGVSESWSTARILGGRELLDSIHIEARRRPEWVVLRSRVPC